MPHLAPLSFAQWQSIACNWSVVDESLPTIGFSYLYMLICPPLSLCRSPVTLGAPVLLSFPSLPVFPPPQSPLASLSCCCFTIGFCPNRPVALSSLNFIPVSCADGPLADDACLFFACTALFADLRCAVKVLRS